MTCGLGITTANLQVATHKDHHPLLDQIGYYVVVHGVVFGILSQRHLVAQILIHILSILGASVALELRRKELLKVIPSIRSFVILKQCLVLCPVFF